MSERERDSLQKFMFEHANIRGMLIHLDKSFQVILEQHHYPPVIAGFLGETLLASALMAATIKFKGTLTVQFHGDTAIQLLVAKCDNELHIRGLAQFDGEATSAMLGQAFSQGQLVVTLQRDADTNPYQSIIPLQGRTITESLEDYFANSEQIPTRLFFASQPTHVAGLLLQLLPEASTEEREHFWDYATHLGATVRAEELFECDNATLLHRLYHEEDIRLFDAEPVSFRCTCSEAATANAIRTLGKEDAEQLLEQNHFIAVTCEYCNHEYTFDKVDVAALFNPH
jgi:molecular chaperone Hsp33